MAQQLLKIRNEAKEAYMNYMIGIENALNENKKYGFITSQNITLADICFFCEFSLFYREIMPYEKSDKITSIIKEIGPSKFKLSLKHFNKLRKHPLFKIDSKKYLDSIDKKST